MPRRNRRSEPQPRPIRSLTPDQLDHLALFAHDHIDSHVLMLEEVGPASYSRAMTLSEDPVTRQRFASVGMTLDECAARLTGRDLSGLGFTLAG